MKHALLPHFCLRLLGTATLAVAITASLGQGAWAQVSGPGQGPAQGPGGGAEIEMVQVIIAFNAPPGQAEHALIARYGGTVSRTFQIVPAVAATLPEHAILDLIAEPAIALVEEDGIVEAHSYSNVWGVNRIGSPAVHDGTFESNGVPLLGSGIRVAVCDTGIDYNHPELSGAYRGGYDFVNNDADPMDDQYHGTHVAGTIAAARNGTGVVGVAPEVDLYGCKVLSSTGSGSWSYIIGALDWCVANQIQVANFSLGSSSDPGTTVRDAFARAADAGIVLVASAGNSGTADTTQNNVGYPARFPNVIAVASTTSSDARSGFSSTGPDVDIAAPGSSVYSTYPGNSYATLSGTSMAAPHVAGSAALILAAGITDSNNNGVLHDEVLAVMQSTSIDLGTAGPDVVYGAGLIQVDDAVALVYDAGGGGPGEIFDPPSNLAGTANRLRYVFLTWADNSNVEEGFEIRYGTVKNGRVTWRGSFFAGADATSASRQFGKALWRFQVRAYRGTEVTPWSSPINVRIR